MPLRSHGSLSLNRALTAAGLVDRIHLVLLESRTLDGRTQELVYGPVRYR